jgi:hypothetical protein
MKCTSDLCGQGTKPCPTPAACDYLQTMPVFADRAELLAPGTVVTFGGRYVSDRDFADTVPIEHVSRACRDADLVERGILRLRFYGYAVVGLSILVVILVAGVFV